MYKQSILDNSIRVVTKKMPGVRSVSIGFLFDASPAYEESGQYGIAHLTEHLMFKGTLNRDVDEIASLMDLTGGSLSAFTSKDYTCYSATVLDDYRPYVLDLMGDMFLNSIFSIESLDQEKRIIKHELAAASDRPDICAHEQLKALVWKGHPLGRPIGGTLQSVESLERSDVSRFVDNSYRANRLIVGAAGNLEHNDFESNLHDVLWLMKRGKPAPQLSTKPEFSSGVTVTRKEVKQVYFSIGLQASNYVSPHRYEIHLLSILFGGGISSRLFRQLRQSRGLVYEVHSEYQAYRDDGMIVIEGATVPDCLEEVIKQIFNEMQGMATSTRPITEDELWKAKTQLKGQHLIASENTQSGMSSLVTQTFYFDRVLDSEEILEQIEAVTLDSLNRCAQYVFDQGVANAAISIVGPGSVDVCNETYLQEILSNYK